MRACVRACVRACQYNKASAALPVNLQMVVYDHRARRVQMLGEVRAQHGAVRFEARARVDDVGGQLSTWTHQTHTRFETWQSADIKRASERQGWSLHIEPADISR
eukprot:4848391-Pleurochrysis_carterae.AAC.1